MWWIFPPKNLEKIRCSKYACADFFFFLKKVYILSINRKFNYLFSSCISIVSFTVSKQVNKVKYSVSVSTFIVLQYTLNKSKKFHTQQIILFVLRKMFRIYTKTFGGKIWSSLHRVFPGNIFGQNLKKGFL